jgi:Cys-tRNA(Pro)/Cys-tRNA(Cys) deacylase
MTPAINYAKKNKITFAIHKYKHDPAHESFGLEAAEKLSLDPEQVFKTLVARLDNAELAVAILPVSRMLNLKSFARACGVKKAVMADKTVVEKTTGYVLGGVSPLGQKKRLKTIVDAAAADHRSIYVSAGRRGLEIELSPDDLLRLTCGELQSIC